MTFIFNLVPIQNQNGFHLSHIWIHIFNMFPTIHCHCNTICWSYNKVKNRDQILVANHAISSCYSGEAPQCDWRMQLLEPVSS